MMDVDVGLRFPSLGVYNHNTVSENGHFQLLHAKISCKQYSHGFC